MDSGLSSESSTTGSNCGSSNRDVYLKQVNKNSFKIAKPVRKPIPPAAVSASVSAPVLVSGIAAVPISETNQTPQSQQPPVYNISKNDFRDVVQKLTGSPSHERFPTPTPTPTPPVNQPRSSSSRLQRIRPPPLAQIGNRPPQLAQIVPRPANDAGQRAAGQPLTPLPPLPSVHPAAESPISAYFRLLRNTAASTASPTWNGVAPIGARPESFLPCNEVGPRAAHSQSFSLLPPAEFPMSTYMRLLQNSAISSAAAPRWTGPPLPPSVPPNPPPQQQQRLDQPLPSSSAWQRPILPLSPLPFGCIPSPGSPYALQSPSLLFSPTGQLGFPQLPLSPTVQLQSPRWKSV